MQRCATYANRNAPTRLPMDPIAPLLRLRDALARHEWVAQLLLRLVFGYFWLETGWAKLHNLEFFSARFVEWGIPFPMLSATVSGATDLVGGALLMFGLGTRLAAIPMIINMLVALAVVVLPTIGTLDEFVELDEVLYVAVLFWLLVAGPGKASLDHLIGARLRR